jgi:predicted nuclease of predicted toxin-antitoxin system
VKLLLDEMYPATLAASLRSVDIDAYTVVKLGLAGKSDPDILAAAIARNCALLTENIEDFAHISAQHLNSGQHHPGILIAASSKFSRRPAGLGHLVTAICAVAGEHLTDRVVYLKRVDQP